MKARRNTCRLVRGPEDASHGLQSLCVGLYIIMKGVNFDIF
jgi:hypothetical protein